MDFYNISYCNDKDKWITDYFSEQGDILISIEEDNPRFSYCAAKSLCKDNISEVFSEAVSHILNKKHHIRCLSMSSEKQVIHGSFEIATIEEEADGYQCRPSFEGNTLD